MTGLVLVLAGTDHHPFDRLVHWVDAAAARHPEARFVVQHGASRPPAVAEGHEFLPHDLIEELLARASGVVCHGGPGCIMDARAAGHVPICVPRDPALGEHVDGHQLRFAALVGSSGVVVPALDPATCQHAIDAALSAGASGVHPGADGSTAADEARARLARELDELGRRGRRRLAPASAAPGRHVASS